MNILAAKVRRNAGGVWCAYTLEVVVENLPQDRDLIYSLKEGRYFFAEKDGYVSFFAGGNSPGKKNDGGFGGAEFPIRVRHPNGSIQRTLLRGPWSGSESGMTSLGFTPSVGVSWQGSIAGHFTVSKANEILKDFKLPYVCKNKVYKHDMDNTYVVVPIEWEDGRQV